MDIFVVQQDEEMEPERIREHERHWRSPSSASGSCKPLLRSVVDISRSVVAERLAVPHLGGMATTAVPHSGPEFEALMDEVDAKLAAEGVDIPSRPLLAGREVSMRFNIPIPMGGDPARMSPELREHYPLSQAMKAWYDEHYGDRLKVNPCPGATVVRLDGDLYKLKVPLLFGETHFTSSRKFIPNRGITRGPAVCNVVQLVEDLTEPRALRLSDAAVEEIQTAVQRALPAIYTLQSTPHELMGIALGDVAVAVGHLMDRPGRYGESKWASLQAAEKSLKAAITLAGGSYGRIHELEKLFEEAAKLGIHVDHKGFVDAIQCKGGIRYGEETCTLAEALDAHRRSLDLVNALSAAGAKFELGLGGIEDT